MFFQTICVSQQAILSRTILTHGAPFFKRKKIDIDFTPDW